MIQICDVTKSYGKTVACRNISFDVADGEVTALLGVNGAGKTTLLKILAGIITPDAGTVTINGESNIHDTASSRKHTGCVFENVPLYDNLSVQEFLLFTAGMYGVAAQEGAEAVSRIIEGCGLAGKEKSRISTLSRGYRQRVSLAQALVHNPSVILLDEPTNGLDPLQLEEFRSIIRAYAPGRSILISTHIMQEVETLCSRAIVIRDGEVLAAGTIAEICAQTHTARMEDAFIALSTKQERRIQE